MSNRHILNNVEKAVPKSCTVYGSRLIIFVWELSFRSKIPGFNRPINLLGPTTIRLYKSGPGSERSASTRSKVSGNFRLNYELLSLIQKASSSMQQIAKDA